MVRKKKDKNYFTKETEDAIILYNNSDDYVFKNKIYITRIHKPFLKLTENIIHTFKFYHTEVSDLKDLQYEIISVLCEKLYLYHHSKNIDDKLYKIIVKEHNELYEEGSFASYTNNSPQVSQEEIDEFLKSLNVSEECYEKLSKITPPKAYSYFGTITKRYLINSNKVNYKKKLEFASLDDEDDSDEFISDDLYFYNSNKNNDSFIEEDPYVETFEIKTQTDSLSDFMDSFIEYCNNNLNKLFPKNSEARIADAVLEIFRKREHIDVFNKKALYLYIKEIIDVKTPKITKVSNKLYSLFRDKYVFYLENGYFNIYE